MSRGALQTRTAPRVMAFDRKTFKDKLQDVLGGALTHFYMTKFAGKLHQTKWVQHWETEVDRLVNMDTVRVLVSHTKGNWDKAKALAESLADVRAAEESYRRVAANYVAKVYRLKRVKPALVEGAEEFYRLVQEAAEAAFEGDVEGGG